MNLIVNAIEAVYKCLWGDMFVIPLHGGPYNDIEFGQK